MSLSQEERKRAAFFACQVSLVVCVNHWYRPAPPHVVNKQDRQVYISRVKPVERKGGGVVGGGLSVGVASYRKAKTWGLSEIRVVDGRSTTAEVTEFDLHIDKTVYKWVASNVSEKKSFISCIYKVMSGRGLAEFCIYVW